MNKEIIKVKDIVIVEDVNGNKIQRQNMTNLSSILSKENVVETLESLKVESESEIEGLKNLLNKRKKQYIHYIMFGIPLGIGGPIILNMSMGVSLVWPQAALILAEDMLMIPILIKFIVDDNKDIKRIKDELSGRKIESEYITKELEKQKSLLVELNNEGEVVKDKSAGELEIIKVDNSEVEEQTSRMQLCFKLGKMREYLLKMLKQGKIGTELEGYSDEEKEFAGELINELKLNYSEKN